MALRDTQGRCKLFTNLFQDKNTSTKCEDGSGLREHI